MPFARIVAGWLAVVALFLLWRWLDTRLSRPVSDAAPATASIQPLLLEALLLVLFAALWFGSLGSGGGYILFPLLGALIELPNRLRQAAGGKVAWIPALSAILRIAVPGMLLGFILV